VRAAYRRAEMIDVEIGQGCGRPLGQWMAVLQADAIRPFPVILFIERKQVIARVIDRIALPPVLKRVNAFADAITR